MIHLQPHPRGGAAVFDARSRAPRDRDDEREMRVGVERESAVVVVVVFVDVGQMCGGFLLTEGENIACMFYLCNRASFLLQ